MSHADLARLPVDFRDLLVELSDAKAEFVVVGGYAVAFHGHPRATKDLDVLVRPTPSNAARVYAALAAFGAPLNSFEVSVEDFADYGADDPGAPEQAAALLPGSGQLTIPWSDTISMASLA